MDERAGGAGDADLGLLSVVLGVEDDDEHRASGNELLARDLLLGWHHTFGAAEVDVDDPGLDPVHDPGRELALVLGDVAQDLVPLEVVDVAQDRVLGRLRGHALEVLGRQLSHLDGATADDTAPDLQRAGLGVELHGDVALRVKGALVGDRERVLHRVQHLVEGDAQLRDERA